MKYHLKCVTCNSEYQADSKTLTCPHCGQFEGTLDVVYPLDDLKSKYRDGFHLRRNKSVFEAFSDIFPFENIESLPSLVIGGTPLFKSPNLSKLTGLENLWIKDDGRNPSASFKDRASAVAIAMAREAKADVIAAASTGNAASSLATLSSSVSLKTVVFVPKNAPKPKLAQILMHGAHVLRLNCDYDHAFDLCQTACERFGWYNRNTAVNPFTGEGKKSAALEIACQLGHAPDSVIVPVGDGCIISGIYKGFCDLRRLDMIDKIPKLYGIQADGANPLVRAFKKNKKIKPLESTSTIADSISVGYPRDGIKALRAVYGSNGGFFSVSDAKILKAQKILASSGGVFAEPAASAAFAGMLELKEKKYLKQQEEVVLLITGHGLKDVDTALKNVKFEKEAIKPDIDVIEKEIGKLLK